jgi:hypothetical protein
MTEQASELAAKCEQATGPDRELDGLIEVARDPAREIILYNEPGRFPQKAVMGPVSELVITGRDLADYIGAPTYTASLDAAMTLAPRGRAALALQQGMDACLTATHHRADDFTQRLPACVSAAALRARAKIKGEGNE